MLLIVGSIRVVQRCNYSQSEIRIDTSTNAQNKMSNIISNKTLSRYSTVVLAVVKVIIAIDRYV